MYKYQTRDKDGNIIEIGGLYKLKKGQSLCYEEEISPVVRFLQFAANPLMNENEKYYIQFMFVFENSINPTSNLFPILILPYDKFFEYFDLYKTAKQVNEIINKNEVDNNFEKKINLL